MRRILLLVLVMGVLLLGACAIPSTPPSAPAQPTITENPRYVYENGAIEVGGDDEPIELINNPNATDPTYAELVAFIKKDSTDEHRYADSVDVYIGAAEVPYVCSDFAEDVHNNAETAGIRTAWVSIDFEGNDEGHALNAFETTDRGLVYIDCTGRRFSSELKNLRVVETEEGFSFVSDSPTSWDAIAYIEVGKEYGLIPIAKAELLLYSFYEEYKQKWQEYEKLVSEYNAEIMQYNEEISGKIYIEGSPELARIEAWEARLKEKAEVIDELGEELGDYCVEPLGIVKDMYIHW
ncbi:MAG: hypothetical protein OEZ00_04160 [Dehalococcoidia bacterium]|nr:hypothetical protein [Dehalococcoidia bacterium]